MRNVKTIIATAVLAAGLLGTGYAYWTDSLSVGGVVSTGSFDINYVNPQVILSDGTNIADTGLGKSDKWDKTVSPTLKGAYYENGICSVETDEFAGIERVKVKISNLYPGVDPVIKLTIKNEGTISAKVEASNVSAGHSNPYPNTGYYLDAYKFKFATSLEGLNNATVISGTQYTIDNNIKNAVTELLQAGIEAKSEQDIYIQIAVNEDKTSSFGTNGMDYAAEFDISMIWQQYNRK